MIVQTSLDVPISSELLEKYMKSLVNKFFKILPIMENNEDSIGAYMDSLEVELQGFNALICVINEDPLYISLLSIARWLIDNVSNSDCAYKRIRKEVFHAISICKKLETQLLGKCEEVV